MEYEERPLVNEEQDILEESRNQGREILRSIDPAEWTRTETWRPLTQSQPINVNVVLHDASVRITGWRPLTWWALK
jgi:hypothetical protein